MATPAAAAHDDEQGVLEQGIAILRNRKWVIAQAVGLVTLVALVLSLMQDDKYTATASLLFRDVPTGIATAGGDNGFVDPAREAATNQELVSLPAVAAETAKRLNVPAGEVFGHVTIDSGGQADVARISATTASPSLSMRIANAYGEAYIDFRRGADRARLQSAIDQLQGNIASLSPEERAGAAGRPLQDRLAGLKLAQALQTGNAELVQRAGLPSSPSSPHVKRNVMFGLLLGGLFGFLLAALLERIDRRVRTVEETEELYDLPVLARIPRSRALAGPVLNGAAPALNPFEREAFRTLRSNLRYFNIDRELRSILVVGHEPGGGKSTVARTLALSMAEVRDSVVLVEADLHKDIPEAHMYPSAGARARAPETGLAAVLAGAPLKQALTGVPLADESGDKARMLSVLPAGRPPPNPSELLASDRMRSLLLELENRYDAVIIDTPALAVFSDALALVPAVSGVVIVCGLGQGTRDGARELRKQLTLVGAHPLGIVANFAATNQDGFHRYYELARELVRG